MRNLAQLLKDLGAQSPHEVVIWKARAVGVAVTLEGAHTISQNIANQPWRATSGPASMMVTREEYEKLQAAGARTQLPRIVASWIYTVLNPQIDHCEVEAEALATSLTFHAPKQTFDVLKPLSKALLPEGRRLVHDLIAELPSYAQHLKLHDGALEDLLKLATTVYKSLISSDDFKRRVADAKAELPEALRGDHIRSTELLAANVVNADPEPQSSESAVATIWKEHRQALISEAPAEQAQTLRRAQHSFRECVATTMQELVLIRQELSMRNDVPIAPVRGLVLESTAD